MHEASPRSSRLFFVGFVAALVAVGIAVAFVALFGLWPRSGWWGLSAVIAVVWGLELSAIALGIRRNPRGALALATLGALLGAGALLIAGFGLLTARLSAESVFSFTSGDPFVVHWALHEKLAALHDLTLATGVALFVPFLMTEATLWWLVRRREDDVARGDAVAARENTGPRVFELGVTLLLFAAGVAVLAGSYVAPVPYAQHPDEARLRQIRSTAADHHWDMACSQLRTAVRSNGVQRVKRDLPGAPALARVCMAGRIARLQRAGVDCSVLVAENDPLTPLAGGGRELVASCKHYPITETPM